VKSVERDGAQLSSKNVHFTKISTLASSTVDAFYLPKCWEADALATMSYQLLDPQVSIDPDLGCRAVCHVLFRLDSILLPFLRKGFVLKYSQGKASPVTRETPAHTKRPEIKTISER
jgi:hypothetical protein